MPQTWSEWLGISGFILAVFSLGWQVWKYRDEHAENVSGEISFTVDVNGRWVVLKLVNCGRVPVYLEKVDLCLGDTRTKVGCRHVSVPFARNGPQNAPLAPGGGATYELDARNPLLKLAVTLPENKVWIAVCTPRRKILRLKGNKVLAVLRRVCGPTT